MAEQAPANTPAATAAPRPRRLLRGLGMLLLGGSVLAAGTGAGLWWWSGQDGSLATSLDWLGQRPGMGLQAQEVSGSLRHGGRIAQLSWQQPQGGMRLQASGLALRWDLPALLRQAWRSGRGSIHLQTLHADLLRLEPGPQAEPGKPPASLQLPLDVRVDDIRVGRLQWAGTAPLEAQDVAGSYRYAADRHQLTLTQARYAQGRYQGQASLQASGDMVLDARLQGQLQSPVPGSAQPLDLNARVQARGPLQRLNLDATLESAPASRNPSQAQLQAVLTPWQDPPLPQAQARFAQLNLAAIWPQAPDTRLSGQARVRPQGTRWHIDTRLENSAPGPWDQGRLPLERLNAQAQWQGGQLLIQDLNASLGPARLQAQGGWTAAAGRAGWKLDARFDSLDTAQLHSRWPAQVLKGQAHAEQAAGRQPQPLKFELELASQGDAPGALGAWKLRDARAQGQWLAGQLTLEALQLRSPDAELQASGQFRPQARSGQGQARLNAPGLQLALRSAWPLTQGAGELDLQAPDAQTALRWLSGLPHLPSGLAQTLRAVRTQGRADTRLTWRTGLADAQVQARLELPVLDWPQAGGDVQTWRELKAAVQGPLAQAQVQAQAQLDRGAQRMTLQTRGQASLPPQALQQALAGGNPLSWRLTLDHLALDATDPSLGLWRLGNLDTVRLRGSGAHVQAEPAQLQLQAPSRAAPARLGWQSLSWQPGELSTRGSLSGLPLAWLELLAGPQLNRAGMVGDLVFDGNWDLQLGQRLRVQAELQRRSGDLSLQAETGQGLATRVAAGVREARLALNSDGEALVLGWRWDSERAGQSQGQLRSRLERQGEGWHWPASAPISGQIQARLPRLGVWSALAPPGWRLRGSLDTELSLSGTRSQPLLNGPLEADDLVLRSVVDGVELSRGRLRAMLEGERLRLDEFSLQGPGAQGGSLLATGEARWAQGLPQLAVQTRLNRLRASVRSDRELTVSGELQTRLQGLPGRAPVEVTGQLRLDQARIRLPDESRPQLDSDVVVRRPSATGPRASDTAAHSQAPLKLAVQLDLGDDFRVEGKGVKTLLRGALSVTANALGSAPRLVGSITTASGEYKAYGQRLDIERGLLRFTGPADNPALDILALRPNLTQRVGVQITGTALLPRVSLYAEPDLPDAEKLAWLVLGRSGADGGAEAAMLQQAAIALLGSRSALTRGGLADTLGLDELSFRGAATQADGSTSVGAITFGKRLSSKFYAAYESSLSGAVGTLFLFYDLSQRLTVRAQTGTQTAVDLIWTLPYD